MYPGIVACVVAFYVITVAYAESTVGTLVVGVVAARLCHKWIYIERRAIPVNVIYSHRGVRQVERLKFSVFVSSVENQLLVVLPHQSVAVYNIRFHIPPHIVVPVVLFYHGYELLVGIVDPQ